MERYHIQIGETIATIIADNQYYHIAKEEILTRRKELEKYILYDPFFLTTLEPYIAPKDAPTIIKWMANVSTIANVGPMAAVAGAIAYYTVNAMKEAGAEFAIVDNGGDIACYINRPICVGIFAGLKSKFRNIGLRLEPRDEIFGICTSSATVGSSLSFGKTDASTIISKDVALADAMATAVGNSIVEKNEKNCLYNTLKEKMVEGIEGMLVIIDNLLGTFGKLPPFVRSRVTYDKITKG